MVKLWRRVPSNGGISMRRISEFKGYKSTIEYNPETGEFITVKVPEPGEELTLDETLIQLERIIPFPEPAFDAEILPTKNRRAG